MSSAGPEDTSQPNVPPDWQNSVAAAQAQQQAAATLGALFGLPRYSGTNALGQAYSNQLKPGADFLAKRTGQAAYNEAVTNAFTPKSYMPSWAVQQPAANWLGARPNPKSYFPGIGTVSGGSPGVGTNLGFGTPFGSMAPSGQTPGGGAPNLPGVPHAGGTGTVVSPPGTPRNPNSTPGYTTRGNGSVPGSLLPPPGGTFNTTGAWNGSGMSPTSYNAHQAALAARRAPPAQPTTPNTSTIDTAAVMSSLGLTNPNVWTSPTTRTNYSGEPVQWSPGDFASPAAGTWQANWNALPPALRVAYGQALAGGASGELLRGIYEAEGASPASGANLVDSLAQGGVRYTIENGQLVQLSKNSNGTWTKTPMANLLDPKAPTSVGRL